MGDTVPLHERMLAIFDFDETLAADSLDTLLAIWDLDRASWEERWLAPLGDGWDGATRRGQALIQAGRDLGHPLDRELLEEAGRKVQIYEGALTMPERLRAAADEVCPGVEVDFHVLSAGYARIVSASPVMEHFDALWASAFHFDSRGRAVCVKRVVSHPGKALYLETLAKGTEGRDAPLGAARLVENEEMRCPYDQMVYVGDGLSDLQAFGFATQHGACAIAVTKGDSLGMPEQNVEQRVDNLAPPSYADDSELFRSLELAVRSIAYRIALRRLGRGE